MKTYAFPRLYTPWIAQLLNDRPVPDESRVTCSDCPMCKRPEPITARDRVFNPSTKCCSYIPILPNFLVGGILLDEDPEFAEGKARFQREGSMLRVTPSGVDPPWHYWFHYYDKSFGESEILRCPYYIDRDGGLCGIWRYRNAQCSTWFCKHDRGFLGVNFWRSLTDLFECIEKKLSEWCIRGLNLIIPEEPANRSEAVWGNWSGREQDFFKQCFKRVSALSWQEVLEISGEEARTFAENTLKKYEILTRTPLIPSRMKNGDFTFEDLGNGVVRIWSYRVYDPVDLSKDVFDKIRNGDWKEFGTELIRKLYELKILIGADETSAAPNAGEDACGP